MKLYRIVNEEIISDLSKFPKRYCTYHEYMPVIFAYQSVAEAILMLQTTAGGRLYFDRYLVLQYELPDVNIYDISCEFNSVYTLFGSKNCLGSWCDAFLQEKLCLLARFPSNQWNGQFNYIINPLHDQFSAVVISDVHPVVA